jgi:hypothetical protein
VTEPTPEVAAAVDAIREQFAGTPVQVDPDGVGGATVTVQNVILGTQYAPPHTWLGFHVSAAYPDADVYPHYVGVVTRADGQPHGQAVQQVTWRERPALQLSRVSRHWNPASDNAANKAEKVIAWMREQ